MELTSAGDVVYEEVDSKKPMIVCETEFAHPINSNSTKSTSTTKNCKQNCQSVKKNNVIQNDSAMSCDCIISCGASCCIEWLNCIGAVLSIFNDDD